jgi:hypothetical protein
MANSFYGWLLAGTMSLLHPFFVSVIDITHNTKDKEVEISVRIFTDDFENVLKKQTTAKVDLLHPTDKAAVDKLISNYINSKLQIKVDGKVLQLKYIGYEQQKESTWAYFEVDNVSSVKKVEVNCNLLYEYQQQQMNIFHVKVNGTEKSYKLDNPKTSTSFEF